MATSLIKNRKGYEGDNRKGCVNSPPLREIISSAIYSRVIIRKKMISAKATL